MSTIETGQEVHLGWWVYDGGPDLAQAQLVLTNEMAKWFGQRGWTYSPVEFACLPADSPYLAAPPPVDIRGRNPQCVLATACAIAPVPPAGLRMTADMPEDQLFRLRQIVRKEWARQHGGETLSDEACDAMIERTMPATVSRVVH